MLECHCFEPGEQGQIPGKLIPGDRDSGEVDLGQIGGKRHLPQVQGKLELDLGERFPQENQVLRLGKRTRQLHCFKPGKQRKRRFQFLHIGIRYREGLGEIVAGGAARIHPIGDNTVRPALLQIQKGRIVGTIRSVHLF